MNDTQRMYASLQYRVGEIAKEFLKSQAEQAGAPKISLPPNSIEALSKLVYGYATEVMPAELHAYAKHSQSRSKSTKPASIKLADVSFLLRKQKDKLQSEIPQCWKAADGNVTKATEELISGEEEINTTTTTTTTTASRKRSPATSPAKSPKRSSPKRSKKTTVDTDSSSDSSDSDSSSSPAKPAKSTKPAPKVPTAWKGNSDSDDDGLNFASLRKGTSPKSKSSSRSSSRSNSPKNSSRSPSGAKQLGEVIDLLDDSD